MPNTSTAATPMNMTARRILEIWYVRMFTFRCLAGDASVAGYSTAEVA